MLLLIAIVAFSAAACSPGDSPAKVFAVKDSRGATHLHDFCVSLGDHISCDGPYAVYTGSARLSRVDGR